MAINTQFPVGALLRILQENNTREAWIDYDAEAYVLYVNFQRPVAAEHASFGSASTGLQEAQHVVSHFVPGYIGGGRHVGCLR